MQLTLATVQNYPRAAQLLGYPEGTFTNQKGSILTVITASDIGENVTLRETTDCWYGLPVSWNGIPMFRDPITFELVSTSFKVDCNEDFGVHRLGRKEDRK